MTSTPGLRSYFELHRQVIAAWIEYHAAGAGTVTDLACGTGEFTELATRLLPEAQVTGIDISPSSLAIARRRLADNGASWVNLVHADFWDTRSASRSAAVVLCLDAIHHLGDVTAVLRRLREYVTPGGLMIGNVWTIDYFHEFGRCRYGSLGHLHRSAAFLVGAVLIRITDGRCGGGIYRTQLIDADDAERLVTRELGGTVEMQRLRYHLVLACRPEIRHVHEGRRSLS